MTHKEIVSLYRQLEKSINRSLKSSKKLKKGERIRAVKYNRNITWRSVEILVARYKRLYPSGKVHEKYFPKGTTVVNRTDDYIIEMIYNRISALESHASGTMARGGSEAVKEAIDWFYELIEAAKKKGITSNEIVNRLCQAFGIGKGGLVDEIEEIILAIYPSLSGRAKRHNYSRYGDSDLAKAIYDRVRSKFPEVSIRRFPWT